MNHVHSVLVVDDDEPIRSVVAELINQKWPTAEIRLVGNGIEGMQILATGWLPCVVILDYMMPFMDGNGFLAALSENRTTNRIPVITTSAMSSSKFVYSRQVVHFLSKPFALKQLLQVLT